MILFRCTCGDTFQVDDSLAGGTGECQNCNREFTIPAQSDPEVALVFKAGSEGDGTPMLLSGLEEKLADGSLNGADLIWVVDHWLPIQEWLAGGGEAAPVSAAAPAQTDPRPKLRLRTSEDSEAEATPPPFPDSGGAAAEGSASSGPPPGGATGMARFVRPEPVAAPKKPWWKWAVRLIVTVVVLGAGYKFGFGPIIANFLKQPSYVIVHNGDAVQYQATLGWRRLSQELPASASCHFQLFVGMPETQALTLAPASGAATTIQVPVRMGRNILVNPGGKTTYLVLDLPWLKQQNIKDESSALAAAIAAGRPPVPALSLMDKLDRFSKDVVRQRLQDELIDPMPYDLDELQEDGRPAATVPDKPRLTCVPLVQAEFADGVLNLNFTQQQEGTLDVTARLPGFSATLAPNVTVKVPDGAKLQFNRLAKRLRLSLRMENQTMTLPKGTFTGTWEYAANWPLEVLPPAVAEWKWQWTFRGKGVYKEQTVNVVCSWVRNEPPKVEITPVK